MTTFYEFQKHPDGSRLKRIMTERYGGTEFDCPKCGVYSRFYRMTRERAYVCQHWYQLHPTRDLYAPDTSAASQVVLRDAPVCQFPAWGASEGVGTPAGHPLTAWRMAHQIRKYMARSTAMAARRWQWQYRSGCAYIGWRTTGGKRGRRSEQDGGLWDAGADRCYGDSSARR